MHACGHVPLFPVADVQSETGTLPGAAGELLRQWDPHLGLVPGIGTLCWALCLVTSSLFLFLQLLSRNIIERQRESVVRGRGVENQ